MGSNVSREFDHGFRAWTVDCFIQGQIYQSGIMWVSFDSVHLNLTAVRLKITKMRHAGYLSRVKTLYSGKH